MRIIAVNSSILPTQSFLYYCYLFFAFYCKFFRVGYWRIIFHHISDGKDECIVPLVVNKKRKQIRSISYYGRLDYDDIICSTNSGLFICEVFKCLCNAYPDYTITWKNINENSPTYLVLQNILNVQEPCVAINLPPTYDEYYSSLSKNQRQNIRTAYNRLKNDCIHASFTCYDSSNPLNISLWNKCEGIYERRHNMIANNRIIQYFSRVRNPYHHILMKHPQRRIYVLQVDDIPLAYMAGLYDEKKKIYLVPRLCINDVYCKYSPGIILINETIKCIISQGVKIIDLMQGDEPYKFAMGGNVHYNYQLQIAISTLMQYVYSA